MDDVAFVVARRKAHIRVRDGFLALQKECASRGDRDGARFFSAEASDALKRVRACDAVLAHLRGDTATLAAPVEIMPALRHEVGCLEYRIAASAYGKDVTCG